MRTQTRADVRALTHEDRPAWSRLFKAYQDFYEADISEAATASTFQRLLDPSEPMWALLACIEGAPVGLVQFLLHRSTWTIADSCYLQDLFVDAGARGQGLGGLLIAHVADAAKTLGCARLYWLTHETNATARVLYDAVADRSGFIQYRKAL